MARKCTRCKTEIPSVKNSNPLESLGFCAINCMARHGIEKAEANKSREIVKKKKKSRSDLAALNQSDVNWQHKQCKTSFNRLRVQEEFQWFAERGLEPECISCGKKNMDWCCGHFKTVGAQSATRYDRRNTFLQCNRYCNQALSGNLDGNKNTRGYKRGLAARFGEDAAKKIIEHCESKTAPVKWDWQEMGAWRKSWNEQFRELQKQREAA